VRAQRRRPDAREHRGGDEEGAEQRRRAHRDVRADPHQRPDPRPLRPLPARSPLHRDEGGAHPRLRDHGAPGRAGQAPAEAVDEQDLEDDVHRVRGDEDLQRRAQVGDPAQVALTRGREHEEGRAERGQPQVQDGPVGDLPLTAHRPYGDRGERDRQREDREPDEQAQPQRLGAHQRRLPLLARAVQPRDVGGRAVGEEVEDREGGGEHRRRDREGGELRRPEVPDDRGVDEHVQRLGGERAERGHGEGEDPAVVRGAQHSPRR
jgi:hypothetical protein